MGRPKRQRHCTTIKIRCRHHGRCLQMPSATNLALNWQGSLESMPVGGAGGVGRGMCDHSLIQPSSRVPCHFCDDTLLNCVGQERDVRSCLASLGDHGDVVKADGHVCV